MNRRWTDRDHSVTEDGIFALIDGVPSVHEPDGWKPCDFGREFTVMHRPDEQVAILNRKALEVYARHDKDDDSS